MIKKWLMLFSVLILLVPLTVFAHKGAVDNVCRFTDTTPFLCVKEPVVDQQILLIFTDSRRIIHAVVNTVAPTSSTSGSFGFICEHTIDREPLPGCIAIVFSYKVIGN